MDVDEDIKERVVMKDFNQHQRNLREDGEIGETEEHEEHESHHIGGGCPAQ